VSLRIDPLLRDAQDIAKNSADASKTAADAATKSAEVAEKTLIATERPRINVKLQILSRLTFDQQGAHVTITFHVEKCRAFPCYGYWHPCERLPSAFLSPESDAPGAKKGV
jgi:hypothetical protein